MADLLTLPIGRRSPESLAVANRRLSDKILAAFYQACEQQDTEVAQELLAVLEYTWQRDREAPWGARRVVNYLLPARDHFRQTLFAARLPIAPEPAG